VLLLTIKTATKNEPIVQLVGPFLNKIKGTTLLIGPQTSTNSIQYRAENTCIVFIGVGFFELRSKYKDFGIN
jgi:hypothetical protein